MDLLQIVTDYLSQLEWSFIITFILIAGYVCDDKRVLFFPEGIRNFLLRVPKIWRVLPVGIAYAAAIYWFRDYTRADSERMFNSLVFAVVFHNALWKYIAGMFQKIASR